MPRRRIVIISDIHVCAGDLDGFVPELEHKFCNFLDFLVSNKSPVELIINGDFLDFIYAPPWRGKDLESVSQNNIPLCFTEEQSLAKLEAILAKHKDIFMALNEFLKFSQDNKLVVIAGNHDPDFFWSNVQDKLLDSICGTNKKLLNKINIFLEQTYHPENLQNVWIEHGNQYDPLNTFIINEKLFWGPGNRPILKDIFGKERLVECVGTRILLKYILNVIEEYPNIPYIKPYSKLIENFVKCASILSKDTIKIFASLWGLILFISKLGISNPNDILGFQESIDPQIILRRMFDRMSINKENEFKQKLDKLGFQIKLKTNSYLESKENAMRLMNFLSENIAIFEGFEDISSDYLGSNDPEETLSLGRKLKLNLENENYVLSSSAKKIGERTKCSIVVFGHTHEKNDPNDGYVNTGSWTKCIVPKKNMQLDACSILRNTNYDKNEYNLYYFEITLENDTNYKLNQFY